MTHFVGIAITQQFIVVRWGALLIVAPAPGAAVAPPGPQGNMGYIKGQAMEL